MVQINNIRYTTHTTSAMHKTGALCGNRTRDLSLTKGVLYH